MSKRGTRGLDPDAVIFKTAAVQHGVVSRGQLLRAGVPPHAIEYRLKRGRLRPMHRGVYRVGPVAARYHREMAAVLACGKHAVLSHRTAAALWKLLPSPDPQAPIEVTGPRSLDGPRSGVRLHRTRRTDPAEVDRKHGLPVTTPARTLLDLTVCTDAYELERALAHAARRRLLEHGALPALLARHRGRHGIRALRTLSNASSAPALTRSEAEARFLNLVRKGHLPRPRANVRMEGLEVDFVWPDRRLVVEIDGYAYHSGRTAFEHDRHRDATLAAAGLRVARFTWRQLTQEPEVVLVRVAQALEIGRRQPGPGDVR